MVPVQRWQADIAAENATLIGREIRQTVADLLALPAGNPTLHWQGRASNHSPHYTHHPMAKAAARAV
ncbi:MAG: hypothetical protein HQM06_14745 [Magnetococcales bacterium]|nr:hypothetical protein [Magnetococcales bacterium]